MDKPDSPGVSRRFIPDGSAEVRRGFGGNRCAFPVWLECMEGVTEERSAVCFGVNIYFQWREGFGKIIMDRVFFAYEDVYGNSC